MKTILGVLFLVASCRAQSNGAILEVTRNMWNADFAGVFSPTQLIYNTNPPDIFDHVNTGRLGASTWTQFRALFDNHDPMTGRTDPSFSCSACETEENDFLNGVIDSAPMDLAWSFLRTHNLAKHTKAGFREELRALWFTHYQRDSPNDTSGFEHVFVGEIRTRDNPHTVTGFHNWWFAYDLERHGNWRASSHSRSGPNRCEAWQFWWTVEGQEYRKTVSSIMKGCSPEYEMAVYTLCFLTRRGGRACQIQVGGNVMDVTTFDFGGNPVIGSAFINC